MAANYSVKELLDVLRHSEDPEVLRDAMSRYGLVSKALIEADAISTRATDIIVAMIPDFVNARKANKTIMEGMLGSDSEDIEEETEEVPAKKAEPKPKKAAKKSEPEPESEDGEAGENDYHSMKAKDLFELCKERGIEAEPRHRTKYYIELLEKADAEAVAPVEKPVTEEDDDDWDI